MFVFLVKHEKSCSAFGCEANRGTNRFHSANWLVFCAMVSHRIRRHCFKRISVPSQFFAVVCDVNRSLSEIHFLLSNATPWPMSFPLSQARIGVSCLFARSAYHLGRPCHHCLSHHLSLPVGAPSPSLKTSRRPALLRRRSARARAQAA